MRSTFKVIGVGSLGLALGALLSMRSVSDSPSQNIKAQLLQQTDSLQQAVKQLQQAKPAEMQRCFREVRLAYKKIEWAAEYFDPITARLVNGPPVPEAEL